MRYLKIMAFIVFFVVSMAFFVQNSGPTSLGTIVQLKLDLVLMKWVSVPLPFYLLSLFFFFAGAVFMVCYFLADKIKYTKRVRDCRIKIDQLEQELGSLRNLPLSEGHYSSDEAMAQENQEDVA